MYDTSQTLAMVEDNQDDVFALKRALARARIINPVEVLDDGQQALDYLAGKSIYADRGAHPLPFLLFLDLKLPFVDGFEVLEWIRQQPSLDKITVVVLTSSPESRDNARAYALGAKCYLVKPPTTKMVREAVEAAAAICI